MEKITPRLNFLNSLSCASIPSPKVHSELRTLNIGLCSKVTDQCLRQIATFCPDLRELDINGCFNTTDLGISYIVRGCQRLELLNISSGSMIQKMSLTDQSLVSIATHCKYLRRLHVEKNPLMSLEGYKNFFDNCPLPCTVSLTTKSPEILKMDVLMVEDGGNKCKRVNVFSKGCYKGNIHQLDVLLYNSDGHILEWIINQLTVLLLIVVAHLIQHYHTCASNQKPCDVQFKFLYFVSYFNLFQTKLSSVNDFFFDLCTEHDKTFVPWYFISFCIIIVVRPKIFLF